MKAVVVDTSALVRLYVPDGPLPSRLEDAIEQAWRAETLALVPELALIEAAQVLHKKTLAGFITAAEADLVMRSIRDLPIEAVGHRDLAASAMAAARAHGLTVYDGVFLALAAAQKADLITADDDLAAAWSRHQAGK